MSQEQVQLQRSVRFGRVIFTATGLGIAVAVLLTLSFPVLSKDYTMAQAVGFMALVGAAIGLAIGGVLSLVLNAAAKRVTGSALAEHEDVG